MAGSIVLIVLAVVIGFGGALSTSQATAGVGAIAFACLLAIFARIAQAAAYERARRERAATEGERRSPV